MCSFETTKVDVIVNIKLFERARWFRARHYKDTEIKQYQKISIDGTRYRVVVVVEEGVVVVVVVVVVFVVVVVVIVVVVVEG